MVMEKMQQPHEKTTSESSKKKSISKKSSISAAQKTTTKDDEDEEEKEYVPKKKAAPKQQQQLQKRRRHPPIFAPKPTPLEELEEESISKCCCKATHIKTGAFTVAILQTITFIIGFFIHFTHILLLVNSSAIPFVSYMAMMYYGIGIAALALLWIGIRKKEMSCSSCTRRWYLIPYIIWSMFYIVACFAWFILTIQEVAHPSIFQVKLPEQSRDRSFPNTPSHPDDASSSSSSYKFYKNGFIWFMMFYNFFIPFAQIYFTLIIYYCYAYFSRLAEISNPDFQSNNNIDPEAKKYRFCFRLMSIKTATIIIGILHLVLICALILGRFGISNFYFYDGVSVYNTYEIIAAVVSLVIYIFPIPFLFIGICIENYDCCLFYYGFGYIEILASLSYMMVFISLISVSAKREYHGDKYLALTFGIIIFSIIIQFRVWSMYISFKCSKFFKDINPPPPSPPIKKKNNI